MRIKTLIKKSYIYIVSFLIPFFILAVSYLVNGIFPGSEKNIFISDMGGQYIGFYSFLRYIGIGYNNIMYQTLSGLGGGYLGTWAYYTSDPLGLLVLFFDPVNLSDAFYFLTLLKVSLCGVTFAAFLKNGHIKCENSFVIIILSGTYALMSYNIIYSLNIMWISGVIMLPLVILGLDNIVDKKGKELFIIALAYSVIANYYTAYMIVLFCVVYFLYRAVCDNYDLRRFTGHLLELFCCGLMSAVLSAWLWLPVFLDLMKGKLSEDTSSYYGFIRNPVFVLRQLLPFSYDGIASKAMPPLYCGLIIAIFLLLYFLNKDISARKKIAALSVFVIFILSFSVNILDMFWQCLRMPTGFPGRYSFIVSFFLISLFAENAGVLFIQKKYSVYILITFLVFADLTFNSVYLINSLGSDPAVGGYSDNGNYIYNYRKSEFYKALGFEYPSRIASYNDYSHVDGLLFGFSSLDYYSSSYNYNVSELFKSLGMNSFFHYSQDSGITPVTASILSVSSVVSYDDINEYGLMFDLYDPVYSGDGFVLYQNPYPGSLGYTYDNDSFSQSVSGNVFENINHLYDDLAGEEVFIKCTREDKVTVPFDEDVMYARNITVFPEEGMHLYMYVSSDDYYDDDKKECIDYLYLGKDLIASYTNMPDRYIADLGYSDGTALNFTFESDNEDNEIFFYSLDDKLFLNSVGRLSENGLYDISYSKNGIDAKVNSKGDQNLAIFLPYEPGYNIILDGRYVQYSSYAGSVISFPVSEGIHDIHVDYVTPGLKFGLLLSCIGLIVYIIILIFEKLYNMHKS